MKDQLHPLFTHLKESGLYIEYKFPILPQGKIRTTQADKNWKWKLHSKYPAQRKRAERLQRYYAYVNELKLLAMKMKFEMDDTCIIEIRLPYPTSYTKKARQRVKHNKKPDWDNIAKGFQDAVCKSDSHVWLGLVFKLYTSDDPCIIAYKLKEVL